MFSPTITVHIFLQIIPPRIFSLYLSLSLSLYVFTFVCAVFIFKLNFICIWFRQSLSLNLFSSIGLLGVKTNGFDFSRSRGYNSSLIVKFVWVEEIFSPFSYISLGFGVLSAHIWISIDALFDFLFSDSCRFLGSLLKNVVVCLLVCFQRGNKAFLWLDLMLGSTVIRIKEALKLINWLSMQLQLIISLSLSLYIYIYIYAHIIHKLIRQLHLKLGMLSFTSPFLYKCKC